ncbi:MAG: hypothetical protein KatS3mg050_3981 [Litorilinea sp.]|nr:MAG: hypothetical protein KatS3mg050_3981 [Litorilinea sp.]
MAQSNFFPWIHRFDGPGVRAIVLMGSHARGDAYLIQHTVTLIQTTLEQDADAP